MNRRLFLYASLGGLATTIHTARSPHAEPSVEDVRNGWRRYLAPSAEIGDPASPLARTEEEWRALLSEPQFAVLRESATEEPFSSPFNAEARPGIYCCTACDLPLFSSEMKFDSGTGWPSFFTTIPDAFETELDFVFLIPRTEYHCARCGGHHGHVFDDGPPPTGERWCNNGVALRFIPRDS
jgi:peptide-methionine (R)-S-oxide reductase